MKALRIIVVLMTTLFVFITSLSSPILAQDTLGEPIDTKTTWEHIVSFVGDLTGFVGESIAQFVGKIITGIGEFILAILCPECTEANPRIQTGNYPDQMKYGLLGTAERQVTAMFDSQPRIDVIAHLSREWVPGYKETQSIYASGYDDIRSTGVDEIWSFTRNIAYLAFVVVMIAVGFMIMFRSKLGGQTLVTLGNTLPRVVISLVLVTFSFAIAGVIIDICGVLMTVIKSLLGSGVPIHDIWAVTWSGGAQTGSSISLVGIVLGLATLNAVAGLIPIILGIIIAGAALVGAIKLWITLVKSYLAILLNVIVAPLSIMLGSLPGNDASIVNIFKSIFRNALVFPIAFAIVNIPFYLETKNISIDFPKSLTGDQASIGDMGPMLIALAKLIAIYAAVQAPALAKAIIPPTASKSGADAAAAIKEGFGKVPFVGSMFK
jgi:hypothetical protein